MRLRAHMTLFEARRRCDNQNILAENGYTITCMGSKMGIGSTKARRLMPGRWRPASAPYACRQGWHGSLLDWHRQHHEKVLLAGGT